MTVDQALDHAIQMDPLDLVARVEHIQMHLDRCDPEDREIWRRVLELTRNGV